MAINPSVLVTLTAPTCGGKSHLFNYIRDVAKLPCLISTTTRPARPGEKEGIDYYFISDAESQRLEEEDQFAELAIYRGVRYGVTRSEFESKLSQGVAFLIVEPSGIEHYAQPAIDAGALHFKVWVQTDPEIRMQRYRERARAEMTQALWKNTDPASLLVDKSPVNKTMNSILDRHEAMLTEELNWFSMANWDRIVFGEESPEKNLEIILDDVAKMVEKEMERKAWLRERNAV